MADVFTCEFSFRNQRFTDAAKGLKAFYSQIKGDWDGSARVLSREMKVFLDQVVQAIATRNGAPWPGGTTATSLSRRSGALMDSIIKSVRVEGTTFDAISGRIGSDLKYARIQELGGTITPKRAKFLTIPLPAALDSSGCPLKSKARDWPNTFCARSKAGNLLIFQRRGKMIVPLYVLRTSVTIPPRLNMRTTLDAGIPYFVTRAMDQMVRAVRTGSNG